MHVSRQTIVALENGRFQPTLQLAFRITHVFNTNIEDIFTPDPEDLTQVDTET